MTEAEKDAEIGRMAMASSCLRSAASMTARTRIELPGFSAIVELQAARRHARERLKELDDALDGLGVS